MASTSKTAVNVVFGAMTIGSEGMPQSRVHTLKDAGALLDIFRKHGHVEIDTARYYGQGTSESMLGDLDWQKRGIVIETKYYPTIGRGMPGEPSTHKPEDLRKHLLQSLQALKTDKVDMWYLHGPDRTTPYIDTLREVNNLYKEGHFTRFGISNYQAWEVAQIVETCRSNNWIQPSVYQGVYNAFHRTVEAELFPCLRHYGMSFYAYNPLAGGYLTSRYQKSMADAEIEKGSRFDPNTWQGSSYRGRYWKDEMFEALEILRPVAKKHGLTEAECALRWMMHHSMMSKEKGDAVIIGASSETHLEENLRDMEKAELPRDVLEALDKGWEKTRGLPGVVRYWH